MCHAALVLFFPYRGTETIWSTLYVNGMAGEVPTVVGIQYLQVKLQESNYDLLTRYMSTTVGNWQLPQWKRFVPLYLDHSVDNQILGPQSIMN